MGIAVKDLKSALKVYRDLLGAAVAIEEAPGMRMAIVYTESGKIELMESTSPDSPVGKFLEKRGEGLHHVALDVTDVAVCLDRARALGLALIDQKPRPGSEGKLIAFVHPKSVNGVLLEFCQD
ncbi:MAG: methylmalonyl-CoA epimerase [Actinobacteria bacterium]|nr:methylmalonyl-CoA epimerase [Actinomycetota bacterium]